jgi:hypothetical protein
MNEAHTTTDSNGFYGFDVEPGKSYRVSFESSGLGFSPRNLGDEDHDSDPDPATGNTEVVTANDDNRLVDAGLLPAAETLGDSTPRMPFGEVGPVRSARLINIHIHDFFQDSCLIFAGSTREIRDQIPHCAEVFAEGDGGVGAMLDISRMVTLAEKNGINQGSEFNYASNLFSAQRPPGGYPVERLDVYAAELNQSAWVYDPSVGGWLRYVDSADPEDPGVLHADTDRLTGRQLYFDNVVVLYAEHEVLAPAILDMHLAQGESDKALLFRDGQMFRLRWSTRAGAYEQVTGLRRPISFIGEDGNAFPLRPGRTWIIVATPYSELTDMAAGRVRLRIIAPPGAGNY